MTRVRRRSVTEQIQAHLATLERDLAAADTARPRAQWGKCASALTAGGKAGESGRGATPPLPPMTACVAATWPRGARS